MVLVPSRHDELPKTQLDGGYLGDGHPLCSARPRRHFLLAGARYVRIIPSWPPSSFFSITAASTDTSHCSG